MPGPTIPGAQSTKGPRIAILNNIPSALVTTPTGNDSFIAALSTACPSAHLDFFDPIDAQEYPADCGADYDLIILSGGTADINAPEPWVLKMLDFVRECVRRRAETGGKGAPKMMGFCWGHQAVHVALGGRMEMRSDEEGPEVSLLLSFLGRQGVVFGGVDWLSLRIWPQKKYQLHGGTPALSEVACLNSVVCQFECFHVPQFWAATTGIELCFVAHCLRSALERART